MNSSTSKVFAFPSKLARRLPDPVFPHMERHIMYVAARDIPQGLPFDPNARLPNLNRQVYREVRDSLFNRDVAQENTFHLKHKGITLVANTVTKRKLRGDDIYDIEMLDGHGILDGGHSYKLMMDSRKENIPESQYVKFEILTNIPDDWVPDLSAGLNTSVQVQPYSIAELEGLFDWIKDELQDKPYFREIAWKEGQDGEYTVKDLIGIFSLFHIVQYPYTGDVIHPISGYSKKAVVLDRFREDQKEKRFTYQKLRPLLHDILVLHDTIRSDGKDAYNRLRGNYGHLKFVEQSDKSKPEERSQSKKLHKFPFTGKEDEYRLVNGALYPILGAFRWMVEEDPETKEYRWKGGFETVLKIWEDSAGELINLTRQVSDDVGRNPNALGKSQSNWTNLLNTVARKELEFQLAATKY